MLRLLPLGSVSLMKLGRRAKNRVTSIRIESRGYELRRQSQEELAAIGDNRV